MEVLNSVVDTTQQIKDDVMEELRSEMALVRNIFYPGLRDAFRSIETSSQTEGLRFQEILLSLGIKEELAFDAALIRRLIQNDDMPFDRLVTTGAGYRTHFDYDFIYSRVAALHKALLESRPDLAETFRGIFVSKAIQPFFDMKYGEMAELWDKVLRGEKMDWKRHHALIHRMAHFPFRGERDLLAALVEDNYSNRYEMAIICLGGTETIVPNGEKVTHHCLCIFQKGRPIDLKVFLGHDRFRIKNRLGSNCGVLRCQWYYSLDWHE